jgi:hypothetical protein
VAIKQLDRVKVGCEKWEARLGFEIEAHSACSAFANVCKLIGKRSVQREKGV